tara:strand:+ start:3510 stop:4121 length:612 start_codon:yes stop_codon:yes gene_type:complete
LIISFFLLNINYSLLRGEDGNEILGMKLARPTSGFSLETGDFGSGLSIFFSRPINSNIQLFGQFKVMDVTGEAEMPVVDYWTGYVYKANPFNLWLMPAFIGLKHHPFLGRIANNFSPFFMVATGPVFIVDLPEYGKFREKLNNIETSYNGGYVLGAGIDFMMQPGRVLSLFMGYDHIRIGDMVEGKKYYGGTVFKIMIGKKLK